LLLRQIAALPHLILLAILGVVTFVIWLIVQWVILFVARYPRILYGFVAGVLRWQTRVTGYSLGLTDSYPPFSFEPSSGAAQAPAWPAAPPQPPAPAAPLQAPTSGGTAGGVAPPRTPGEAGGPRAMPPAPAPPA